MRADSREVVRMTYAMIDAYCASYPCPPVAVTLDIDDTVDVGSSHQQLSLFNAPLRRTYPFRLPAPRHETATSRPVAMLLRPGKTPSGDESAGIGVALGGAAFAAIGRPRG